MAAKKGSAALILIGVFITGGIFFLAAYGVYIYTNNLRNVNDSYPQPPAEELNAPVALDYLESEEENEAEKAIFNLPSLNIPEVIPGVQQVTYRFGDNNSITVAPKDNESLMVHSIGSISEESITVAGVESRRITGSSEKDGSLVHIIIVPTGGQILFIRGEEEFLTAVQADLELK